MIRILLFRVIKLGSPVFGNPQVLPRSDVQLATLGCPEPQCCTAAETQILGEDPNSRSLKRGSYKAPFSR